MLSAEVQPDSVVSGFTSVVLSKSVKYNDQDGNVLFTAPAISPRASTFSFNWLHPQSSMSCPHEKSIALSLFEKAALEAIKTKNKSE